MFLQASSFRSPYRSISQEDREALARYAASDAGSDTYDPETAVVAQLGAPPAAFDPVARVDHVDLTTPPDPYADDAMAEVGRLDERLRNLRHWFSFGMLSLYLAADGLSNFQVLKSLEIPPAVRWLGVLGLVATSFSLVHRARASRSPAARFLFGCLFIALSAAVAAVRVAASAETTSWPETIIFISFVVGMPLLAVTYVGRQSESWPLFFRTAAKRRLVNTDRARQRRNRSRRESIQKQRDAWERRAIQGRSIYELAHRVATAEWARFRKGE